MPYQKTEWKNKQAPSINESNLNKIEQGLKDAIVAINGHIQDGHNPHGVTAEQVNADLGQIHAAVDITNANVIQTGLDLDATNANVLLTNADVVQTAEDRVQTGLDVQATGLDVQATNADVLLTNADALSTAEDVLVVQGLKSDVDDVLHQVTQDRVVTDSFRQEAQRWANEDEDVVVESGLFSAKHWAIKSERAVTYTDGLGIRLDDNIFSVEGGDGLNQGSSGLSLGVPSSLDNSSVNSVSSDSHTHEVTFPVTSVVGRSGDVVLSNLIPSAGLSGGSYNGENQVVIDVVFGDQENTVCEGNDPRLSNNREPTAHTHDGADIVSAVNSAAYADNCHRSVVAGSGLSGGGILTSSVTLNALYGSEADTICEGNDARLSDERDPLSHGNNKHEDMVFNNLQANDLMMYNGTHWVNKPESKLSIDGGTF